MSFLATRGICWLVSSGVVVAITLYGAWLEYSERRQRTALVANINNRHYRKDDSDDDDQPVARRLPDTWRSPYAGADLPVSTARAITNEEIRNFPLQNLAEMVDDLVLQSKNFQTRALEALTSCKQKFHDRANFHWRLARSLRNCSYIELLANNQEKQKELLEEAFQHAQESVRIDEECPLSQRWLAIIFSEKAIHYLNGCRNDLAISESILKKALRNNPDDHYLARELFFINLKDKTSKQSETCRRVRNQRFQWHEQLPSIRSQLYMALYGIRDDNDNCEAETYITEGLKMPIVTPEDEVLHKEIAKLAENLGVTFAKSDHLKKM